MYCDARKVATCLNIIQYCQSMHVTGDRRRRSRAASGITGKKRLLSTHKLSGLGSKPRLTAQLAGTSEDILSKLHEEEVLPASEYRIVLSILKGAL